MNNFTYHNPVKVVFGLGTLKQAGDETAKLGKRALVVSTVTRACRERLPN